MTKFFAYLWHRIWLHRHIDDILRDVEKHKAAATEFATELTHYQTEISYVRNRQEQAERAWVSDSVRTSRAYLQKQIFEFCIMLIPDYLRALNAPPLEDEQAVKQYLEQRLGAYIDGAAFTKID